MTNDTNMVSFKCDGKMKLLTRDTDYAVRALVFIVREKRRIVPVSNLVEDLKIPRPFLRKILQKLNKKGVLKSHKGKGGGFELAILPKKIPLADLIEIFQGPLKFNECLFKKKICPNTSTCALRSKINSIEKSVFSQLKGIDVASLANRRD